MISPSISPKSVKIFGTDDSPNLKKKLRFDHHVKNTVIHNDVLRRQRSMCTKPNLKLAQTHNQASRVSKPLEGEIALLESDQKFLCACCGMPSRNELFPLGMNIKKLAFLGPGIPLYFLFFRLCLIQLLGFTLCFGAFMTYENFVGTNCKYFPETLDEEMLNTYSNMHSKECSLNSLSRISLINKSDSPDALKLQSWFVFGQIIISFVYHQFLIRQLRNLEEHSDANVISPSDYTIMVQGIPQHMGDEKTIATQIKKIYEKTCQKEPIIISKVCLTYNIAEYIKMTRELEKLTLLKTRLIQKAESRNKAASIRTARTLLNITNNLSTLNKNIPALESMYQSGKQSLFTGVAFVTLETQTATRNFDKLKEDTLKGRLKTIFEYFLAIIGHKRIIYDFHIDRAPEPGDVLWENLGFPAVLRMRHRIATFFLSAMLLTISFTVLFVINLYVNQVRNSRDNADNTLTLDYFVVSLAKSSIVVVLNIIINLTNDWFAKFEKRSTISEYLVSSLIKISVTQFFNTALVLPLASYFAGSRLWLNWDLLFQITLVIFVESFSKSFSELISVPYFIKLFKRWQITRNPNAYLIPQSVVNSIFEGDAFRLDLKCSYLIRVMWTTAFFTPLVPMTSLVSLIGLFLKYWSDKYLLLRRHVRPNEIGPKVNTQNVNMISMLPFIFASGHMMFSYFTVNDLRLEDIFPIAIAVSSAGLVFLLPMKRINKFFFKRLGIEAQVFSVFCPPYRNIKHSFLTDYDRANPVTHEIALKTWMEEVEDTCKTTKLPFFNNVHEIVESITSCKLGSSPNRKSSARLPRPSFLNSYAGVHFTKKIETNTNTGNISTADKKLISVNVDTFKLLRTLYLTRKALNGFKIGIKNPKRNNLNLQDTPPGEECPAIGINSFSDVVISGFSLRLPQVEDSIKEDQSSSQILISHQVNDLLRPNRTLSIDMGSCFKKSLENIDKGPPEPCSKSLENVVETQSFDPNLSSLQNHFTDYFVAHENPKRLYDFEETM